MSEIEKAIEVMQYLVESSRSVLFKSLVGKDEREQVLQGINVAIQALQEKLERDKGCEYCNNHIPINNFTKDYSIEVDNKEISVWEDLKCLAHIETTNCPMCGRKLVE